MFLVTIIISEILDGLSHLIVACQGRWGIINKGVLQQSVFGIVFS